MSFRLKRRGLHVTLTACAVSVGVLAGTSQVASAFVECPSFTSRPLGATWRTIYPRREDTRKGVALCHVGNIGGTMGWLQIADLGDGAKVRLHTDVDPASPEPSAYEPDTLYRKRVAEEWYSWIRSLPSTEQYQPWLEPSPTRLFSVTNATFFKDSDNDNETTLPLPLQTWAHTETLGVAFRNAYPRFPAEEWVFDTPRREEDYDAPKKALLFDAGFWGEETQQARVQSFPTAYEIEDIGAWYEEIETFYPADAAVGFTPEYRVGEYSRRNYVGVYGDTVYVFVSQGEIRNSDASAAMQEIQPGMQVVQMDGGGSAQFYSRYGEMDSSLPWPLENREVPNVLAIYSAP
jgi:hypothetical protein